MSNNTPEISKLLSPFDLVTALIVLIGVFFAAYPEEIEYTLIGISIVGLGILAFVMSIRQRMNDIIRVQPKSSSSVKNNSNYQITVKREGASKRQVIENFNDNNDSLEKSDSEFLSNEEGFRVVRKANNKELKQELISPNKSAKSEENIDTTKVDFIDNEPEQSIVNIGEFDNIAKIVDDSNEVEEPVNSESVIDSLKSENKISEREITEALQEVNKTTERMSELENYESSLDYEEDEESKGIAQEMFEDNLNSKSQEQIETAKIVEFSIDVLIEDMPSFEDEPRKEFEFLISKLLIAIRSVGNTKTATFILYNPNKMRLGLESYATDQPEMMRTERKFPVGNDVVSQIATNGKPEIVTEINPKSELDLVPYYTSNVGIKSFVGAPVFYNKNVLGVITADSTESDAYDASFVSFLGNFTKIISGLFKSYVQKYDLMQAAKTLDAVSLFKYYADSQNPTFESLNNALLKAMEEITEYVSAGIITWSDESEKWQVTAFQSKTSNPELWLGKSIELKDGSPIAKCLNDVNSIYTTADKSDRIFFPNVDISDDCNLAFYPLCSDYAPFAVVFVVSDNDNLKDYLSIIVDTLISQSSTYFEKVHYINLINRTAMADPVSGLLNVNAFMDLLNNEFSKSRDLIFPSSLCCICLDRYVAFDGADDATRLKVLESFLTALKAHLKEYETIGQIDENTFAVFLINNDLNKARIRAERMRSDMANTLFEYDGKKFNFTASFGIAELKSASNYQELLSNANQALDKASVLTNSVVIFD